MNEKFISCNLVTKMTKNHQGVKVSNFVITISHCNFHKGYIKIYIYITFDLLRSNGGNDSYFNSVKQVLDIRRRFFNIMN